MPNNFVCDVDGCGKPATLTLRFHLFVYEPSKGAGAARDADGFNLQDGYACSLDHGDALLNRASSWLRERFPDKK